jgi:predicted tellurium resistance membrane protein TerC
MEWIPDLGDPQIWIGFLTLTVLEVVLGIDNIIFISILADRLPGEQRDRARVTGLLLAMGTRILLLLSLAWMIQLTAPLFTVWGHEISGRDLILLLGGLFLLAKSVHEIHDKLEGYEEHGPGRAAASFTSIIVQILLLDIVFSLDSVITAVGMVDELAVMVAAVIVAVIFMLVASKSIADFVSAHPTVKMLALSFLLLIGMTLVAEGLEFHIPKGYVYFAMGFAVMVEMLNLRLRKKTRPVQLHQTYVAEPGPAPAATPSDTPTGAS